MNYARLCLVILAAAIGGMGAPAHAQQTPEGQQSPGASTPPAAQTTSQPADATQAADSHDTEASQTPAAVKTPLVAGAASTSSSTPTPETVKKAREAGFKLEFVKGVAQFCRYDAVVGTRFETKRCMNELQLDDYIVQLKLTHDLIRQKSVCTGSAACGGG